ncbi:hypothetical protein NN561_008103 [Cricetulus griseus]
MHYRSGAISQSPQLHRACLHHRDKLPPSGSLGWQLLAGFPTSPFAALTGRAFSAPLQPPVTSAQRFPQNLSNKAGAGRRPSEGLGLAAGALEPWLGIHAPASAMRRSGRNQARRESVLLQARKPPGLISSPSCPWPSASCCPSGTGQGGREKQCGLSGLMDQPLPYLCPE